MEGCPSWKGTPSELLEKLNCVAEDQRVNTKARLWPKRGHILTRRLNEVQANLAAAGIQVTRTRSGAARGIILQKTSHASVTSVTSGGRTWDAIPYGDDAGDADDRPRPGASHQASFAKCNGDSTCIGDDGSDATSRAPAVPTPEDYEAEERAAIQDFGGGRSRGGTVQA